MVKQRFFKYIKTATQSPDLPNGLPIYVNPAGLNEADKTPASTIRLELKGVPLKRTLQLALQQLDLAYGVNDGVLIVSYDSSTLEYLLLAPAIREPSEAARLKLKDERGELNAEEAKRMDQLRIQEIKRLEHSNKLEKLDPSYF